MEVLSDGFIKKIQFKSIRIYPIFSKYFQSSVILYIPMIASEKSHQNLLDRNQFLLQKRFDVNKKPIFSGEKITNSDSCIYDYAHSYFGEDF